MERVKTKEEKENVRDSYELLTEKADGRLKSRIVVDGHGEEPEGPIFASVAAYATMLILIALAFILGFAMLTLDVRTAFLQSAKNLPGDERRGRRSPQQDGVKLTVQGAVLLHQRCAQWPRHGERGTFSLDLA